MPLSLADMQALPPYDPAADASGSSDPLGTLAVSERLAEMLLPGLTARMWRARLLTSTLARPPFLQRADPMCCRYCGDTLDDAPRGVDTCLRGTIDVEGSVEEEG
jgi:hypothetical protein